MGDGRGAPGTSEVTPARSFGFGPQVLDGRGAVVWTHDVSTLAPSLTVADDLGFTGGNGEILALDLLTGTVSSRIPLAPLGGDVRVRAASQRWVVASVVGRQTVLVGTPY